MQQTTELLRLRTEQNNKKQTLNLHWIVVDTDI
jgi:hypothetical protein